MAQGAKGWIHIWDGAETNNNTQPIKKKER